jgi:hypothetical protein
MTTLHWIPDASVNACCGCSLAFTFVQRRHHCRQCGLIYCARCANQRAPVLQYGFAKPVRVCNKCFEQLAAAANIEDSVVVVNHKPRIVYERLPSDAGPSDVPRDLLGKHYYFDNINRQSAEKILAAQPIGCCLFRRSSSDGGGFVISARRPNNKCSHFLVEITPDGLYALQASDELQTFADALAAAAFLGFFPLPAAEPPAPVAPVIREPNEDDEEQLERKNVPDTLRRIAELGVPPSVASQALLQNSGNVERTLFTLRQSLSSDNIANKAKETNDDDTSED